MISRNILERKGYKTGDAETVAFLVEEYLLLVKPTTRKDINDDESPSAVLAAEEAIRVRTGETGKDAI